MIMRRMKVTLTTAPDGSVIGYTPRCSGELRQIEYVKDGSNGFAAGVDFAITGEATGINLWTQTNVDASAVVAPRLATHTQAGVAATLDGTVAALDKIALSRDRVKIAITNGGNAKVGTFHVLVD
jgi:hypothetical protein